MNPTFRQMETSAREVHENMNAVIDYQTHHRLRETQVGLFSISLDMTSIDFPTQPAINLSSPRDVIEQKIWTSELWSGVSLLHLPSCVSALGRWYIMLVLNLVIWCFNILLHLTIKIRSSSFPPLCSLRSQVFVLKSFFSEKRPSQMYGAHW